MARTSGAILFVGLLLSIARPSPASAQQPPEKAPDDDHKRRAAANRLTELGTQEWESGSYELALIHFRQAYEVLPSASLRYNMGLALSGLGRDLEAVAEFELFVAQARNVPVEAIDDARGRIEEIDRRLGKLQVGSRVPGVAIFIDGKRVGETPLGPIRVNPGAHVVSGRKQAYGPTEVDVTAKPGRTTEVDLILVASAIEKQAPPPRRSRGVAPWLVGGAGLVAAGAGVFFGLRTLDRSVSDEDASRAALYANLGFGVAGASAFVVGILVWPRSNGSSRTAARDTRIGVGPGQLVLTGAFP